jgi:hypothetical protein
MKPQRIIIFTDKANICVDALDGITYLTILGRDGEHQIPLDRDAARRLGGFLIEQAGPAQALEAAE